MLSFPACLRRPFSKAGLQNDHWHRDILQCFASSFSEAIELIVTCTHSRDDYVSEVGPASDAGCVIQCGKTIVEGGGRRWDVPYCQLTERPNRQYRSGDQQP